MITSGPPPPARSTAVPSGSQAAELLAQVVEVTRAAGAAVLAAFSPDARPADRQQVLSAAGSTEDASERVLREGLAAVRPAAARAGDELATVALPPGEFWVVDAVEGLV